MGIRMEHASRSVVKDTQCLAHTKNALYMFAVISIEVIIARNQQFKMPRVTLPPSKQIYLPRSGCSFMVLSSSQRSASYENLEGKVCSLILVIEEVHKSNNKYT